MGPKALEGLTILSNFMMVKIQPDTDRIPTPLFDEKLLATPLLQSFDMNNFGMISLPNRLFCFSLMISDLNLDYNKIQHLNSIGCGENNTCSCSKTPAFSPAVTPAVRRRSVFHFRQQTTGPTRQQTAIKLPAPPANKPPSNRRPHPPTNRRPHLPTNRHQIAGTILQRQQTAGPTRQQIAGDITADSHRNAPGHGNFSRSTRSKRGLYRHFPAMHAMSGGKDRQTAGVFRQCAAACNEWWESGGKDRQTAGVFRQYAAACNEWRESGGKDRQTAGVFRHYTAMMAIVAVNAGGRTASAADHHLSATWLNDNQLFFNESSKDIFRGLDVLFWLDLRFNQIEYLPFGIFNDLISLQVLYIRNNRIENQLDGIPNLQSSKSLSSIYFEYNNITNIAAESFAGLNELTHLNLGGNNIKLLRNTTFKHVPNIVIMSLDSNQIKGTFDVFNNLINLTISGNNIT
uniref:Uncharacterized protein n=1 Tax=Strigamia maritima TaxID=126957 RepID=T1INX3_STRMM